MEWSELSNAVVVILALMSGLFILDKFIDMVKKYKKPSDDIAETIRKHSEKLVDDDKRIKELEETVKETNRIQNRVLLQMCNHMIDGNHVDKLKQARDDMEEYLVSH